MTDQVQQVETAGRGLIATFVIVLVVATGSGALLGLAYNTFGLSATAQGIALGVLVTGMSAIPALRRTPATHRSLALRRLGVCDVLAGLALFGVSRWTPTISSLGGLGIGFVAVGAALLLYALVRR